MKKLPPIHGLLKEAVLKETHAAQLATESRSQKKDPRLAHEAGEDADRLAKEAGRLREMATADGDMVLQIETLVSYLQASPHGSALRTLAMRDLQSASGWLRREIGDAPERVTSDQ